MEQRVNIYAKGFAAVKGLFTIGAYLAKASIEPSLTHLVLMRVSQINGCAYCLDMHSKDAVAEGENPQRLFMLNAWRESPLYNERERAALAWAEAVTNVTEGFVPDEVYYAATRQFSEQEMIDLTMAIVNVNSFNRINVAFRVPAGNYVPGQFAAIMQ